MSIMALSGWLYGPLWGRHGDQTWDTIAPLTINIDDLRDFDTKLRQLYPKVEISVLGPDADPANPHKVADLDEIFLMPARDRPAIRFSVFDAPDAPNLTAYVELRTAERSLIATLTPLDPGVGVIGAIETLGTLAKRRVDHRYITCGVFAASVLAVLGTFVWACWSFGRRSTVPVLILLGLVLIPICIGMIREEQRLLLEPMTRHQGMTIDVVSRAKFEEDRRNRHRDRRVLLQTLFVVTPITTVIGILIGKTLG
jgi:hypothetical protein